MRRKPRIRVRLLRGMNSFAPNREATDAEQIPMVATVWHIVIRDECSRWVIDFGGVASLIFSLFGTRGYDAASVSTNADLYAFSNQHRNALHEMRRTNALGHDRAARQELRHTDVSLHAVRFRRKLPEGTLTKPRSAMRCRLVSAQALRRAPRPCRGPSTSSNLRR
jgi:hypothetical protein